MTDRSAAPAVPAVCVKGLTVQRGRTLAVNDVSFQLDAGTLVGLLGPSGCGKTTLMRSLVGTQVVTSGTVSLFGKPAGSPTLRNQVGYVTQAPSVYQDLTVRENLSYFATVLGRSQDSVTRVIADVDLLQHAASIVGRLSGGEKARVSLATALLGSPSLLVLDEPTVGLDPLLAEVSGRCSTGWPRPERRCSFRATSWTKPNAASGCSSCGKDRSSPTPRPRGCCRARPGTTLSPPSWR